MDGSLQLGPTALVRPASSCRSSTNSDATEGSGAHGPPVREAAFEERRVGARISSQLGRETIGLSLHPFAV